MPGLTEPLNIPSASLEMNGDRFAATRVVAVMGTSVFSGRIEHPGGQKQPWEFDLHANSLSLEQGAQWFEALGLRRPVPSLQRLPGITSLSARRLAASKLFSELDAKGQFSTPAITYRNLTLKDVRASIAISGRTIRIENAKFKTGGGRALGDAQLDLTSTPARLTSNVTLMNSTFQSLAPRLPLVLRQLRGLYSGTGHFETRGLTHQEMTANLQGQATVHLKNVHFGDFDPVAAVARAAGWGSLEPTRNETILRRSTATLRVHDGAVFFENAPLDLVGAKLKLEGSYGFDGVADLEILADLRRVGRRWLSADEMRTGKSDPIRLVGNLHLTGPLSQLVATPETEASRTVR
jgi:hypothetical protein